MLLTNSVTLRALAYDSAFLTSAEAAPVNLRIWPTYALAASTAGGGDITADPPPYGSPNWYVSNTVVTLTATAADGWSFLQWTGDSEAVTNVIRFAMDRPRAVQAVFGAPLHLVVQGDGQVPSDPPAGLYAFGSMVQMEALPGPGFYFFGWAGAFSGFANPLSFSFTNPPVITALFGALKTNQLSLTVLPNGSGSVSVSPSLNVYTNGQSVTLTAVAASDSRFAGWSGEVVTTSIRCR